MRSLLASALAAALLATGGLALSTVTAAPASAATTKVVVKKIPTKTAPYQGKVTVKPVVSASGKVKVSAKTLTVKKGSKTVAKNKASVKLAAGTYKVTSKVTYKTYTTKTTTKNVTKKKVGVAFGDDVNVTCTATKVAPYVVGGETWWVDVTASCTSTKFDGSRKVVATLWDDDGAWWGFDDDMDELTVTALPTQGSTFAAVLNPGDDLMKTYTAKQTTTTKVWSAKKTKSLSQTLVVKQRARPSRTNPVSAYDCPSWAPIKGNANSGIYHVPGGRWYDVTKPEDCFTTTAAARAAGYRASKNG